MRVRRPLEFRLLGPLEVWRNGSPVPIVGERQRAVLALLLLRVNEVVPSDQLIEALFGPDAPPTASNSLQAAVSRLRKRLDPDLLVTRPRGYVLRVQPDFLDLARFLVLMDRGARELESGDASAAAMTLREALALWRGPPLADLLGLGCVDGEIRRLDELRLSAVIRRVDADLALGRDAELIPELEALVEAHPLQERLQGQLMLALYRSGRQTDALRVYRETRKALSEELGLEPGRPLQELEQAILRQDPSLELESGTTRLRRAPLCPFKGLASFAAADAEYYFGQERLVAELVSHLAESTFVGVVGPSGSGKSSLVQAGLLPALANGALPGSNTWAITLIRPGSHPFDELPAIGQDRRLVLAVDQLEEVFTACDDETERAGFLARLVEFALDPERRVVVIVALRADFYGRCASYASFASLLSTSHVLAGPMQRAELARAITGPAKRAGLDVEPELVDALVSDLAGEPGALPLLSTSLLELWRMRDGRALRLVTYRQAGGVHGAVARVAEDAYAKLAESERPVARALLLRLVAGEESAIVRRRVPLEQLDLADDTELAAVVAALTEARLLTVSDGTLEVAHEAVLTEWPRLRGWLEDDRDDRRLQAHLAGGALEWANRNRDPAELYRGARLSAALDWAADRETDLSELESEFLAESSNNSEREEARQRRQNRRLRGALVGVGILLALAVAAGLVALSQRRSAQAAATAALARQLGAEAVSEPRIDMAMLMAREALSLNASPQTEGALLATLLRSPLVARTFPSQPNAVSSGLALSPDGRTLALNDSNGELRLHDSATWRLHGTVANFGGGWPVVYSPDGLELAGIGGVGLSSGSSVDVRNSRTLRLTSQLPIDPNWQLSNGGPAGLVFAPNGRSFYLAYAVVPDSGAVGPTYVDRWDLRSGTHTWSRVGIDGALDIAVVAGGRYLVVSGTFGAAVLDAITLRRVRLVPLPHEPITAEAIRPDGRQLAVGTRSGNVTFVDLASHRASGPIRANTAAVQTMSYSPDGRTLVSFADDGDGVLLSSQNGTLVERLTGNTSRVLGAAFTRDGHTLWTLSVDGTVFEWALASERRFGKTFTAGPSPRQTAPDIPQTPPLAMSPDGTRFAVRLRRFTVGIYSTDSLRLVAKFAVPAAGEITAIAWGRSGLLAVTGRNGTVDLWSTSGRPVLVRKLTGLGRFHGQSEVIESVAFSPDGRLVAAGDVIHTGLLTFGSTTQLGSIAVWDARSGGLVWTSTSTEGSFDALAFSPDGKTLAAAIDDGVVHLFDLRTRRVVWTVYPLGNGPLNFDTVAYSPQGLLATGSYAGIVQLWDTRTRTQEGHLLQAANAPIASIAFNPTGQEFTTTAGSPGAARIWTSASQQQFGADFPNPSGQWQNALYTPDGSRLVIIAAGGDGSVFPTTLNGWEAHACTVAGRNFTHAEWSQLITGHSYTQTCPQLPASK
jgi:WD40 repeat protein/DNA-binding SARP family transcriptional activator